MSMLSETAMIGVWNRTISGNQEKTKNKPKKKFAKLIFFVYSFWCGCDSAVRTWLSITEDVCTSFIGFFS
jgi:hypothetical protein